jgi:hypothetical protein
MKGSRAKSALPVVARRALRKLGADISMARRRRGITAQLMAERAFTTRNTLRGVERGDPTVSMANYATVLFVLGMINRLADLADASADPLGRELAEEQLPKRVRTRESIQDDGHGT